MHWIKYFTQVNRKKNSNDRLVMTILCRNEVDIIEENIRTHAHLGIDAFAVMDNGSTDGTREKLQALANEFELHIIDQKKQTYQQAKWMKSLVHYARDALKANWVISNDADEFWIPRQPNRDLKFYLNHKDSVVTVKRHNMVLTEQALEPAYHFSQADYYVQYPFCYDKTTQMHDEKISMLFAPLSPKVIVNPYGFIKISGGNHRAKHIAKTFSARMEPDIVVYHYPIRSWNQFEANIQHRQKLLMNPNARMGNHYRRWVRILEQGHLKAEFENMLLNRQQLLSLESLGVLNRLPRPIILRPNIF